MGNLKSNKTSDEWDELEKRAIKINTEEGITDEIRRRINTDMLLFGQAIVHTESPKNSDAKLCNDKGEEMPITKKNSDAFEWYHESEVALKLLPYGTKEELGIKKLVGKIPMSNKVISDENMVYDFHITNEGVRYRYLYSAFKEK